MASLSFVCINPTQYCQEYELHTNDLEHSILNVKDLKTNMSPIFGIEHIIQLLLRFKYKQKIFILNNNKKC